MFEHAPYRKIPLWENNRRVEQLTAFLALLKTYAAQRGHTRFDGPYDTSESEPTRQQLNRSLDAVQRTLYGAMLSGVMTWGTPGSVQRIELLPNIRCQVSVIDSDGVRHSVTVTASSLFEAAAAAVAAFRQGTWAATALTAHAVLRIEVHPPPVIHDVPLKSVERWMHAPTPGPHDRAVRERAEEQGRRPSSRATPPPR
jgi:hypothetical protein